MCVEVYVFVVAYETDRAWKNCFCESAAVKATTARLCIPYNMQDANKCYVKFFFSFCAAMFFMQCEGFHSVLYSVLCRMLTCLPRPGIQLTHLDDIY